MGRKAVRPQNGVAANRLGEILGQCLQALMNLVRPRVRDLGYVDADSASLGPLS